MRYATIATFVAAVFFAAPALRAQTLPPPLPPAENLTAARELVQTMKATDQLKALLPIIMTNMKAAIVQNRPEMEKSYDTMVPLFTEAANARLNEFADQLATVYARHFTIDELHQITAFYKTPTGQKMIGELPAIAKENMALGQQFGRSVALDIQTRALESLRKHGDN
jgi:uncharacterized protein